MNEKEQWAYYSKEHMLEEIKEVLNKLYNEGKVVINYKLNMKIGRLKH